VLTTEMKVIDETPGHVPSEEGLEPTTGLIPKSPPGTPAALRLLAAAVDWSLVLVGGTMVTLVFANVLMHFAGHDLALTIELCELLMVWATFLGGASAAHRGAHMAITEFLDKLGESKRRLADAAIQVVTLVTLCILTWFGWIITASSWGNILTVLGIPMAIQYMALPIGAGVSVIFVGYDLAMILAGESATERYGVHH
jgi:TRAP-type C4-dicarboxylate transport system permease small subunit